MRRGSLGGRRGRPRQGIQSVKTGNAPEGFGDDSSSSSSSAPPKPRTTGGGPCAGIANGAGSSATAQSVGDTSSLSTATFGSGAASSVAEPAPKRMRPNKGRLFLPATGHDPFLEQLKENQKARCKGVPTGLENVDVSKKGSFDQGDPCTTNLFIGHLSPHTDEDSLQNVFGQFGPVCSVKIMWPRTEEEHSRGYNSGFVSFMHRPDAARALQSLQDVDIDGHKIRLAWGRAVRRVPQPLPPRPGHRHGGSQVFGTDESISCAQASAEQTLVQPPTDLLVRRDINRLAYFVVRLGSRGPQFEAMVAERERASKSKRFSFLWDLRDRDGDDGVYYRWRVYSLANGDTDLRWRTAPFAICKGGILWNPPSCMYPLNNPEKDVVTDAMLAIDSSAYNFATDGSSAKNTVEDSINDLNALFASVSGLDDSLSSDASTELDSLLDRICTSRNSVARSMCFCVDHCRCAGSISVHIVQRLVTLTPISSVEVQKYIGLVFLIADLLHNSGSAAVPGASVYRNRFERLLPEAFRSLGAWFRAIDGRLTAHKAAVGFNAVFAAWKRSAVYPAEFVESLRVELFGAEDKVASMHDAIADINKQAEHE